MVKATDYQKQYKNAIWVYWSRVISECHLSVQERDLGVLVQSDLRVSSQCTEAAKKAMKILGIIRRQFKNMDKETFLILYKGFVRPHMEYAIQAWSPHFIKDINCLEKVQRRACLLYTSPSPRDGLLSRMPSSA